MSISWTELHLSQTKFMVLMIYQLLFKIFKTILPSNAKRKYMYEKTFIVYRCKKKIRQLELKKLRGKNAKIILLSVVWILLHQVNACVHILLNKQMKHTKKLLLYFTCHLGCLYLCIFCPSKTSFNILSDLLLYRYSIETFEDDRALNVKVSFNRRFLSPIFIFFDEKFNYLKRMLYAILSRCKYILYLYC